jgi:hypothetical protein
MSYETLTGERLLTIPELEHEPKCKDGRPCPLPPPVRPPGTFPTTGCEGCRKRYLLVTYGANEQSLTSDQDSISFWCDQDVWVEHRRQWNRAFPWRSA